MIRLQNPGKSLSHEGRGGFTQRHGKTRKWPTDGKCIKSHNKQYVGSKRRQNRFAKIDENGDCVKSNGYGNGAIMLPARTCNTVRIPPENAGCGGSVAKNRSATAGNFQMISRKFSSLTTPPGSGHLRRFRKSIRRMKMQNDLRKQFANDSRVLNSQDVRMRGFCPLNRIDLRKKAHTDTSSCKQKEFTNRADRRTSNNMM